jgi:hypothetical protein
MLDDVGLLFSTIDPPRQRVEARGMNVRSEETRLGVTGYSICRSEIRPAFGMMVSRMSSVVAQLLRTNERTNDNNK